MSNGKKIIYKNAPLAETIFEIRFPGEPSIECKRDKFYERIRERYPKVSVPISAPGKALALEPYKFEQENADWTLALSINKISMHCRKYLHFDAFKEEVIRLIAIFKKVFGEVSKLDRTGLRYINMIPFIREKETIPLRKYLNVSLNLPESISNDFSTMVVLFVSRTEGGSITTRIEPAISQDKKREIIILDFDYAKEKNLNIRLIEKYLDESHSYTKMLFENLLSDDYKKIMKGEVI
jgi:uncharacterized protein (TIGR04255 family)